MGSISSQPKLPHANKAGPAEDDVAEDFNPRCLAGLDNLFSEFNVAGGWQKVAAWMVVGILLGLFDANPLPQPYAELVFTTAIAVNEMVLAVWLIAKGFNPVATAVHSAPVTKSGIGPAAVGETA